MSWFDPPPLVKKPRAFEALQFPPGVKPIRVRRIVLLGALVVCIFGVIVGFALSTLAMVFLKLPAPFRLPATILGGVLGMFIGGALSMRAMYAAAAYGKAREPNV